MKFYMILYFTISIACYVDSNVLPIEKCQLEDGECMKEQFQKATPVFMGGIPELGIPVLDVMNMEDFKFDLSGLKFSLTNGTLKGLKSSVIDSVKWDVKKKTFQVNYHLDCVVKGQYTAGGRILILPITGDGDIKMKLKNIQVIFNIDYEIEKLEDSKDHLALKKLRVDFEVKDNANFQLTNLFNGNKELSDAMLKFLNENWQQISAEFGRPIIEVAAKILFKNVKTYFKNYALSDIAIV